MHFQRLSRIDTLLRIVVVVMMMTAAQQLSAIGNYNFPLITQEDTQGGFALYSDGKAATIWVDANDYKVVHLTAQMLADDVQRVTDCGKTDVRQASRMADIRSNAVVIAGTLGHSGLVDELISKGKIDVSGIRDKWESFVVTTIDRPAKGISKAFVIVGSDRRGTAFGVTSLSEAIGVSPWYWWADVTPQGKSALYISAGRYMQGEPSVRYRGIFINDERFGGWARWAELTFDKEHGVVGPKTYQKVFELLLRLKANYLWPAMHPGTQAFNADPANARLADDYAIVMGTSHCEQMLRNNEDEWKRLGIYGDFNYLTNRQTMLNYWEERIKTNGQYENTYTIGLRGIHDYPMEGASTNEERVKIMQQAISDQRDILARNINKDIADIPQVLCTYEEVLDAYHGGLQVPDDVTLLWSDDKQGFMRNLCNPHEQHRKGGAGIYYHLSYHGDPDSWFWLSPLSPGLICAELTKAYEYGANRIWVFNVGDIKPAEKELTLAMDMAWDVNRWTPTKASQYIRQWICQTMGEDHADDLAAIHHRYCQLMAYGKEFHTRWLEYTDTEIDERLQSWDSLQLAVNQIGSQMPEQLQDAYYELFAYPIQGAAAMNRYVLLSRRSLALASQRNADALTIAADALQARDKVDSLTRLYNEKIAGGKWGNFFNWHPNWYLDGTKEVMQVADSALLHKAINMPAATWILQETVNNRPTADTLFTLRADRDGVMPLWIKARTRIRNNSFAPEDNEYATIAINGKTFRASALPHGNVWHTDTIGPMWSCVGEVPVRRGVNRITLTDIVPHTQISAIYAGIQPPFVSDPVSRIKAYAYTSKHDESSAQLTTIPLLGYSDGVTTLPFQTPSYDIRTPDSAPWLEYTLPAGIDGGILEIRTLPTLRIYEGRDARYAVSVDGAQPSVFSIHEPDYSSEWRCNVLRGYTRRFVPLTANAHKVRIYLLDPGVTILELLHTR